MVKRIGFIKRNITVVLANRGKNGCQSIGQDTGIVRAVDDQEGLIEQRR